MRKRLKNIVIAMVVAHMMMTLPINVTAHETDSSAVTAEEETTEADIDALQEELDPVENVVKMIEALTGDNLTPKNVQAAKEAYDALSMAQKLKVDNYDALVAVEKEYALLDNRENSNEDFEKKKNDTSYNFRISNYTKQLTLTLRLIVDADGDGIMDVPDITLISPDGTVYSVGQTDNLVSDDTCNINIVRTSSFIQMDVVKALDGIWHVESTKRVVFELSDYVGEEQSDSFTPSDGMDNANKVEDEEVPQTKGTNPLVLVFFLIGVVGLFVGVKKLTNPKEPKKNIKRQTDMDESLPRPLTPEEQIAQIRAEWEKTKSQYADDDDDSANEKEEPEVNDDFLAQTIEDFDEDEELEDFDLGFFGHARFSNDD